MGIIYLAGLIIGLGTILVQLAMSGHGDASHDLGLDADGELGGGDFDQDLSADADLHADAGQGTHEAGAGGGGFLPILLSLRFWTFGLMAFGLTGTLLHYLDLASVVVTPILALAMGLASGLFASWAFRALGRSTTQSGAGAGDAVGAVGKVLVPFEKGSRGKVRVTLLGQTVDYLATTDQSRLEVGEWVMVEQVRDGVVQVSRAPSEFVAGRLENED